MNRLAVSFAFLMVVVIVFAGGTVMGFELRSSAFAPSGTIPREHTCDGADLSPPLTWSGVPEGTSAFAIICDDPDAPGGTWVHWVVYDLPGGMTGLPEGVPPAETVQEGGFQGINDFGRFGYGGPCPPPGRPHRYFFRLYALDGKLGISSGARKKDVIRAMKNHILGQAELMGKYAR